MPLPQHPAAGKALSDATHPPHAFPGNIFFLSENRKYFLPTQDYNCSVPLISTFTVERSFSSKTPDKEYSKQTDSAALRLLTQ